MRDYLLEKIRKQYISRIDYLAQKKNLLCKLYQLRDMIEDDPVIQDYLRLNKDIDSLEEEIKFMQDDIKEKTIAEYIEFNKKSSQDIKVYLYIDDIYDKNDNLCSYYFNVISGLPKEIPIYDVEKFEKDNIVIDFNSYVNNSDILNKGFDCQGSDFCIEDIIKIIQKEFITNSIENGYDHAVQKILSKVRK